MTSNGHSIAEYKKRRFLTKVATIRRLRKFKMAARGKFKSENRRYSHPLFCTLKFSFDLSFDFFHNLTSICYNNEVTLKTKIFNT